MENILRFNFERFDKLEASLACELGLSYLNSGFQIIRNDRGWRENEIDVEHIWIVEIFRSFVGQIGLFSVKFNESEFRGHVNPKKTIQGIFFFNDSKIEHIFIDNTLLNADELTNSFKFNLLEGNTGNSLGSVGYTVRIITNGVNSYVEANNPISENWQKLESELYSMGGKLADKSKIEQFTDFFKIA